MRRTALLAAIAAVLGREAAAEEPSPTTLQLLEENVALRSKLAGLLTELETETSLLDELKAKPHGGGEPASEAEGTSPNPDADRRLAENTCSIEPMPVTDPRTAEAPVACGRRAHFGRPLRSGGLAWPMGRIRA